MKWKCWYYYMATGMDFPDISHKLTVEADTREEAREIWLRELFGDADPKERAWMSSCFDAKPVKEPETREQGVLWAAAHLCKMRRPELAEDLIKTWGANIANAEPGDRKIIKKGIKTTTIRVSGSAKREAKTFRCSICGKRTPLSDCHLDEEYDQNEPAKLCGVCWDENL